MSRKSREKKRRRRHVFSADIGGPLDYRDVPIGCRHCGYPAANSVHLSGEEIAPSLPPVPDEDVSDRILGEGP